ncbi:MAG: hypothetical protein NVV63_17160 [Opitutus sp.]|nr:hypothetical protein [Opitutus sp.]
MFLPEGGATVADLLLVPLRFERVEFTDQAQHALGRARPLGSRLDKPPTSMRPTSGPLDVGMSTRIRRVSLVAVRVQNAAILAEQALGLLVPAGQPPLEDDVASGT